MLIASRPIYFVGTAAAPSSSTFIWTVPPGCVNAFIQAWAGGAGGAGGTSTTTQGGGGGGGAWSYHFISVKANDQYTVNCGGAGPGGAAASNGHNGTLSNVLFGGSQVVVANAGLAGGQPTGGAGGAVSLVSSGYAGGAGGNGRNASAGIGGGGGGSAGSCHSGFAGTAGLSGGAGGAAGSGANLPLLSPPVNSGGLAGAAGGAGFANATGAAGLFPGGGGGGGGSTTSTSSGGPGGNSLVIITPFYNIDTTTASALDYGEGSGELPASWLSPYAGMNTNMTLLSGIGNDPTHVFTSATNNFFFGIPPTCTDAGQGLPSSWLTTRPGQNAMCSALRGDIQVGQTSAKAAVLNNLFLGNVTPPVLAPLPHPIKGASPIPSSWMTPYAGMSTDVAQLAFQQAEFPASPDINYAFKNWFFGTITYTNANYTPTELNFATDSSQSSQNTAETSYSFSQSESLSLSSVLTLSRLLVYTHSLLEAVTPIAKEVSKTVSFSLSQIFSLIKNAVRSASFSLTETLTKPLSVGKNLTYTLSEALTRGVNSISKSLSYSLSETLSKAAAITKTPLTYSLVQLLTKLAAVTRSALLYTLTETLTVAFQATIKRTLSYSLAESLAKIISARKAVIYSLTGTLSIVKSAAKNASFTVSETATRLSTAFKALSYSLAETLTRGSNNLTRSVAYTIAGTLSKLASITRNPLTYSLAETLSRVAAITKSPLAYSLTETASILASLAFFKSLSYSLSESLTRTVQVGKKTSYSLSETLTRGANSLTKGLTYSISEALTKSAALAKTALLYSLSESLSKVLAITKTALAYSLSATLTRSSMLVRTLSYSLSESLSQAKLVGKKISYSLSETLTISRLLSLSKQLSYSLTEALTKSARASISKAAGSSVSSSLQKTIQSLRSFGLSTVATLLLGSSHVLNLTYTLSSSLLRVSQVNKQITAPATAAQTIQSLVAVSKTIGSLSVSAVIELSTSKMVSYLCSQSASVSKAINQLYLLASVIDYSFIANGAGTHIVELSYALAGSSAVTSLIASIRNLSVITEESIQKSANTTLVISQLTQEAVAKLAAVSKQIDVSQALVSGRLIGLSLAYALLETVTFSVSFAQIYQILLSYASRSHMSAGILSSSTNLVIDLLYFVMGRERDRSAQDSRVVSARDLNKIREATSQRRDRTAR